MEKKVGRGGGGDGGREVRGGGGGGREESGEGGGGGRSRLACSGHTNDGQAPSVRSVSELWLARGHSFLKDVR